MARTLHSLFTRHFTPPTQALLLVLFPAVFSVVPQHIVPKDTRQLVALSEELALEAGIGKAPITSLKEVTGIAANDTPTRSRA